jgi:AcrR family transcriptional regulator
LREHLEHVQFVLDFSRRVSDNLNMFKNASQIRSQGTRERILTTALALFRQRGVDHTTMRDISRQAGVALGAAYYYFPSKEAILLAYYDHVQQQHRKRVVEALAVGELDLQERLKAAFHTKLDILESDRKILGVLFRYAGEPDHPLSALGQGTQENRQLSIGVFDLAIGREKLPRDIRAMLPTLLWAAHLAMLLYFIYDESPGQARTHKLVDGALSLIISLLSLAKLRLLKPFRGRLAAMLGEADLMPETSSVASPLETGEPS